MNRRSCNFFGCLHFPIFFSPCDFYETINSASIDSVSSETPTFNIQLGCNEDLHVSVLLPRLLRALGVPLVMDKIRKGVTSRFYKGWP